MASGKILSVDALRVVAIMEELTEKLAYLSVITRQVLEAIQGDEGEKGASLLSAEVARKAADQIRLEELYHGNTSSSSDNSVVTLGTEDIQEITENLEKSTRDLCRRMRDIPNVVQELRMFQETRPTNSMKLIHALADMQLFVRQDVLVKRMKTTVEEERAREELLEKYIQQERAASSRRAELETQLTSLRTEREKASNRSSEIIMKLKADLQDVGDFTDQRLTQLHEQYSKREAEIVRNFEFRVTELRALVSQQQKQNMTFFNRGEEETDGLKTRKKIAVKDLEKVIENYDREMLDKESRIRELKEKNTADEAAVSRLQALLQVVEEESERLRQEQSLELAREQLAKTQLVVFSKAASFLQSYWRGILQREEYIQMKKNARGKKNRGKKKKK